MRTPNPPPTEPSRAQDEFRDQLSLRHDGESICVGRLDALTGNVSYTTSSLQEWVVNQSGRVVQERVNASVHWNQEA